MFSFDIFVLLSIGLISSSALIVSSNNNNNNVTNQLDYRLAWQQLENFTKLSVNNLVNHYASDVSTIIKSSHISNQCQKSIENFIGDIKLMKVNALKQFDSMGGLPTGLLDGTWIDSGSFHECLELPGTQYCFMFSKMPLPLPNPREGWHRPINGQQFNLTTETFSYLTTYAHFFRYLNLTTGLCVPKLCSKDEIKTIAVKGHQFYRTGFTVDVDLCTNRSEFNPIVFREMIAGFIIILVVSLNVVGTMIGGVRGPQFLAHFNMGNNWKRLFQPRSIDADIPTLNGIKSITMAFMILVHIFFLLFYPKYISFFKIPGTSTSPLVITFFLGPFTVDTFFLITGLEMTLTLIQRKRPFNLTGFLVQRYLRFATVIGWTICCYIILFSNHTRDWVGGPYWPFFRATGTIPVKCGHKWPLHMLLIAHYFNIGEDSQLCLLADWYLEADYLFAVMFLLILIPSLKGKFKISYLITMIYIVFGSVAIGLIMHFGQVQHTWQPLMFQDDGFIRYLAFIHGKPWGHISPYFIGVLLGFKLTDPIKINKMKVTTIWIIWAISWVVLTVYEAAINLNIFPVPYLVSLAYGMFSKILWSFIVSWTIWTSYHGYAHRWITKLLSLHLFTVLSRINLSVLFVNLLIVRFRNSTIQSNSFPSLMDIIFSEVIPLFVVIYSISFIFSVLIEGPTINLIRAMNSPKKSSKTIATTEIVLTATNGMNNKPQLANL